MLVWAWLIAAMPTMVLPAPQGSTTTPAPASVGSVGPEDIGGILLVGANYKGIVAQRALAEVKGRGVPGR